MKKFFALLLTCLLLCAPLCGVLAEATVEATVIEEEQEIYALPVDEVVSEVKYFEPDGDECALITDDGGYAEFVYEGDAEFYVPGEAPMASPASDFVIENGVLKEYVGPGGDVVIPEGVTYIDYEAFRDCTSIASVVMPETVEGISVSVFDGCINLVSVTIPDSCVEINKWAFAGCESLVSIKLPNALTQIDHMVFAGCRSLKTVTIPNNVTSIQSMAFMGCDNLESIYIPNSVTWIDDNWPFDDHTTLIVSCGSYAYYWATNNDHKCHVEHTPITEFAVSPTCITEGKTEGSHCATCGVVLVEQQPIPATGHTPVTDPAVAATCTAEGKTEGSHCAVCGAVIVAQQPIPATGHSPVTDAAVAPAYGVEGRTEGSHCSVCGAVLVAQQPIPALTYQELALGKVKNNGTITLAVGEQRLIVPAFATAAGWTVNGYQSNKPAVASIDGSGLLAANAEGKAKITVSTNEKKKATLTVKVVDPYKPTGIAIAQGKAVTITMGQPLQLNVVLAPETARATLTWTCNKPDLATVDSNGLVHPNPWGEGKAKITVTTQNKKKATITVQVVSPYKPLGIAIAQGKAVTMKVGESVQLGVGLNPATARRALTWKTNKPGIASVDGNGVVTAVKKGKAKITVTTYNKKKATITVNVVE